MIWSMKSMIETIPNNFDQFYQQQHVAQHPRDIFAWHRMKDGNVYVWQDSRINWTSGKIFIYIYLKSTAKYNLEKSSFEEK